MRFRFVAELGRRSVLAHEGEHGSVAARSSASVTLRTISYFADAGGEDEGADAAAVFLVAGGEGY